MMMIMMMMMIIFPLTQIKVIIRSDKSEVYVYMYNEHYLCFNKWKSICESRLSRECASLDASQRYGSPRSAQG
jgi:hypothetical protein